MSKSASTATLFPAWKQEVNRRVADHMSHKTTSASEPKATQDGRPAHGSRAAQAAARVAERYAHAPSYSEILAVEARAAMRAAEAASEAAQQAQAAVQYMLDGLEASATSVVLRREVERSNAPAASEAPEPQPFDERPLLSAGKKPEGAGWLAGPAMKRAEDRQAPGSLEASAEALGDPPADEAGVPIYANLIQFPRQMVATRRMRPRRAEGPLAAAPAISQLSIFEVDPGSISTQPAPAIDEPAAPVWMRAGAASTELDAPSKNDLLEEPVPQGLSSGRFELAPLNRRSMALVVDASLILATFLLLALLFASRASQLAGLRTVELAAAFAVLAIGAAYYALFLTLSRATPGMRYAGLALTTFDGLDPSRAQRLGRFTALLLSVLPLGLGLVWALFDDDHLMGHDRLSKTYLRMR